MLLHRTFPKMPPELIFVLKCAKYTETETEKEKISTLLSPNIDWDLVLRLSMIHGVFPLVYNTLSILNSSAVPEYVSKILKLNYIKNALKVVGMNDEIVRIVNNMEEYGLQPLILKGSPLSIKIYEDITLRPSSDIDILVDPLEFARAEKILEKIGYKRYSPDFPLTPRQQKAYFKRYHHFEYFNLNRSIHVELHWRIRSFNVKRFPTSSNLNIQKINIAGCLVPVMNNEYWLIFLMVHGYKHMWSRLRWLYDIKEFMKLNIDWDKLIIQADDSELRPIINQTLILANKIFDVPIPDRLKQSVENDHKAWQLAYTAIDKLSLNIYNKNAYNPKILLIKNNILNNFCYFNPNIKNKIFFLFFMFKPSEKEFKLISLPDFLFPFYYFIKPFYWLWRRIIRITPKLRRKAL